MRNSITIVKVPSEAGTHWGGQARAPEALLSAGIAEKLRANGFDTDIISALQQP